MAEDNKKHITGADVNSEHIYEVDYVQNPEMNKNSDVPRDKKLYYSDLDPQQPADVFLSYQEAQEVEKGFTSYFPKNCIKLYQYYYIKENNHTTKRLIQVIPKGTDQTNPDNEFAGLRDVNKKHLKTLYNSIDYIRIERPKNTIKWYTVSNDELNTYLSIMKSFYGLTNFPDKVGDYYFSKKIGKWLATDELKEYGSIGCIDLNDDNETDYPEPTTRTVLDYIIAFFKGLGEKLKNIFGLFFNKNAWDNTVDWFFNFLDFNKDDDIFNYSIEAIERGELFTGFDFPNLFTNESGIQDNNITDRINNLINEFNTKVQNLRTQMMDLFNGKSLWDTLVNLWNNIKTIINNIFDLDLPTDNDNN